MQHLVSEVGSDKPKGSQHLAGYNTHVADHKLYRKESATSAVGRSLCGQRLSKVVGLNAKKKKCIESSRKRAITHLEQKTREEKEALLRNQPLAPQSLERKDLEGFILEVNGDEFSFGE